MGAVKHKAGESLSYFGFHIVASPLLTKPKLRFNWPEPTPVMQEFNRWLLDNFGSLPSDEVIKVGNTLYVSNEVYRKLRELDFSARYMNIGEL